MIRFIKYSKEDADSLNKNIQALGVAWKLVSDNLLAVKREIESLSRFLREYLLVEEGKRKDRIRREVEEEPTPGDLRY